MSSTKLNSRRGFTLLTILWILSVAAVAAMAAALAGRNSVGAGRNRVEQERAYWRATGCARRAQAAIDALLDEAITTEDVAAAWRTLGAAFTRSPLIAQCDVSIEAAGTRLDINSATDEMISRLAAAVGFGEQASDMADALHDWRDADDSVQAGGAERSWYEQVGRPPPRNGPLADIRELARVRGFEDTTRFDSLLSVEPGRISLSTAPVTVLLAVPGVSAELAEAIVARQDAGAPVADLTNVLASVSNDAAAELSARYPDAVRVTTPDPDAWLVRSTATSGAPPNTVILQWRLVRLGRRAIVVQTRTLS